MRAAVVYEFGGPTIHMENVARPFLGKDADATSVPMEVKATGVCRSDRHAHQGHDGDVCVCETTRTVLTLRPGDRVAVPFLLGCGTCECTDSRNKSGSRSEMPLPTNRALTFRSMPLALTPRAKMPCIVVAPLPIGGRPPIVPMGLVAGKDGMDLMGPRICPLY
jgi:hypothetical protein